MDDVEPRTKRRLVLRAIYVSIGCVGAVAAAGAFVWWQPWYPVKFWKFAEDEVQSRNVRIDSESAAFADHEWAGKYHMGDGLGVNVSLSLSPEAGFTFEWHGCMGLYDRNYGNVTSSEGVIRLHPIFENEQQGLRGIATEFTPVRWGDRRYLVPPNEMIEFCNKVNQRTKRPAILSQFLLNADDVNKEVYGEPGVPPEFRKYLLKKTVDASTIAVGASKLEASIADFFFKDTVITLNVGKKQGVFVGMEFQLMEPDEFESATVMKIFPDRCEAMVRQIDQESNPPQVDWRWSTARRNLKVENE